MLEDLLAWAPPTRLARAEHDRAVAKVEADKLRAELVKVRDELSGIQAEARTNAKALREAQTALKRAQELLAIEKGRAAKAASAGGTADPSPKDEYDFMYGRSFEDPDGHLWGVNWMDMNAFNAQLATENA